MCIRGFGGGYLKKGYHFEDPGVGGKIILNWIFKKWDGARTGLI
jgi:hypothetical protein